MNEMNDFMVTKSPPMRLHMSAVQLSSSTVSNFVNMGKLEHRKGTVWFKQLAHTMSCCLKFPVGCSIQKLTDTLSLSVSANNPSLIKQASRMPGS